MKHNPFGVILTISFTEFYPRLYWIMPAVLSLLVLLGLYLWVLFMIYAVVQSGLIILGRFLTIRGSRVSLDKPMKIFWRANLNAKVSEEMTRRSSASSLANGSSTQKA